MKAAKRQLDILMVLTDGFKTDGLRESVDFDYVRWHGAKASFEVLVDGKWYPALDIAQERPSICTVVMDRAEELYRLAVQARNDATMTMQANNEKVLVFLKSLQEHDNESEDTQSNGKLVGGSR